MPRTGAPGQAPSLFSTKRVPFLDESYTSNEHLPSYELLLAWTSYLRDCDWSCLCDFPEFQKRGAELRGPERNQQHVLPHLRHQVQDVKGISLLCCGKRVPMQISLVDLFFIF